MFQSKQLRNIERAFEVERESYLRTIKRLEDELNTKHGVSEDEVEKLKRELATYYDMEETLADRAKTIAKYEAENFVLKKQLEELDGDQGVERLRELSTENERLTIRVAELERQLKTGKVGLNIRQKEEYKRLKQKEYQQKWLKKQKKAAQKSK